MRNLVILSLFLYTSAAVALDDGLLNSVLQTSDKKGYDAPKLTVIEFKTLVDKLAICETSYGSEIVEVSNNIFKIQYKNSDSMWGEGGYSEFTIAYLKHEGEYLAYLQTHDRGSYHIWDEDRFIPSSEIVDMVRIMAANC